jgi:hypothetical protein
MLWHCLSSTTKLRFLKLYKSFVNFNTPGFTTTIIEGAGQHNSVELHAEGAMNLDTNFGYHHMKS